MDFQEFILSRRSIRKYTDKKIDKQDIIKLLEAAMAAPSAVAMDPWHFFAVTQRDTLHKLSEILPHGKMLNHAPWELSSVETRTRLIWEKRVNWVIWYRIAQRQLKT
jgi:nitroreductase